MNEKDQEIFDTITKLSPEELTPEDVAFLNARRGYLTTDQKRIFDSVLVKEGQSVEIELETEDFAPDIEEVEEEKVSKKK